MQEGALRIWKGFILIFSEGIDLYFSNYTINAKSPTLD
jgi:hypothetical protein